MADLTIHVNTDTQDQPYSASGVDWTQIDLSNDRLIFTGGSDTVADGEVIPSDNSLNQAGIVITGEEQTVDTYLLADDDADELKEIHNAGNQNKRYVFAFVFDGSVASEPVLEVWDDSNMTTVDNYSLGEGTPSNSWVRGVVTTDGLPGADWAGSKLAGSSDGHFLLLNNGNGAFTGAKTLYCNLKIVIPANFQHAGAEQNFFVCKYYTS